MIDLLLWLLGGQVEEVSAYGTRIATQGTRFRYPDCVAALLKFKKHGVAKVTSNYGCVFPHYHLLSVYGTKATFVNHYGRGKIFTSCDVSHKPAPVNSAYQPPRKGDLIPSFVRFILGEGKSEVSTEDIFKVMSVCFAIDESVRRNRAVKVKYL